MTAADDRAATLSHLYATAPGAGRPGGPGWVSGEAREPLTGTHVRWHLRVEAGTIREARWEVRGCPYTIAAAGLLAGRLPGRPVAAPAVDPAALAAELGAPREKLGRLFVIEDAVRAAALQVGCPDTLE